jgi:hypothetical protein
MDSPYDSMPDWFERVQRVMLPAVVLAGEIAMLVAEVRTITGRP